MIPDEAINTTLGKPGHLYLADIHVFHGNSGSPIMVDLSGARNGNLIAGSSYRLLGVISGFYSEALRFCSEASVTTLSGTVAENSGIAMVVPANDLKELFGRPRAKSPTETPSIPRDYQIEARSLSR